MKKLFIFILVLCLYEIFISYSIVANTLTSTPDTISVDTTFIDTTSVLKSDTTKKDTTKLVNKAFGVGEKLTYSIRYGVVRAGEAIMSVEQITEFKGRKCYHLVSTAESNKTFSSIYKVRDRIESFFDVEKLRPVKFEKHIREGKFKADEVVEYNHDSLFVIYPDGEKIQISNNVQDVLSVLYYTRNLDLKVGMEIDLENHADRKNYPLKVVVHKKEQIKVPAGTYDCILVEPMFRSDSVFKQQGKLLVWLTDDEYKVPVLMKSQIIIGSIDGILTEMKLGEVPVSGNK
jgi:hypothetical protein